jgi:hypothetical protein
MNNNLAPLIALKNWGVGHGPDGEPILILELQDAGTIIVSLPVPDAREMAQALASAAAASEAREHN